MFERNGVVVALVIGVLGLGATYTVGGLLPESTPSFITRGDAGVAAATGLLAGILTRGPVALLGSLVGYGGAWMAWAILAGGFTNPDYIVFALLLIAILTAIAAFSFVLGRIGRRLLRRSSNAVRE
jgi:hypothetical protein